MSRSISEKCLCRFLCTLDIVSLYEFPFSNTNKAGNLWLWKHIEQVGVRFAEHIDEGVIQEPYPIIRGDI